MIKNPLRKIILEDKEFHNISDFSKRIDYLIKKYNFDFKTKDDLKLDDENRIYSKKIEF